MSESGTDRTGLQRTGSFRVMLANLGWLLGGRVFAAVFSLIYLAILTRSLGPERFGQFSLIIGVGQAVSAFVQFQTWQIVVRFGMSHLHDHSRGALTRLVKLCLLLDAGAAVAGALIGVVAITILAPRFGWTGEDVRLALLFTAVSLVSVRSTPAGVMRLFDSFARSAVTESMLTFARLGGALVAALVSPDVLGFVCAWSAAELAAAALMWWGAWSAGPGIDWRGTRLEPGRALGENLGLISYAFVTNAGQTFALAGKQLPVLITGVHAPAAAAGGYRIALQLGNGLVKLSQLIARTLFPEMVRTRTFATDGDLERMLKRASIGGVLLSLLMLAVLLGAGKPLLVLISGEAYAAAYPIVLIVGVAAVIDFAGVSFEPGLYACGREKTVLYARLVTTSIYVAAMFVAGDRYGVIGVAYATLGNAIVSFFVLGASLKRAVMVTRSG